MLSSGGGPDKARAFTEKRDGKLSIWFMEAEELGSCARELSIDTKHGSGTYVKDLSIPPSRKLVTQEEVAHLIGRYSQVVQARKARDHSSPEERENCPNDSHFQERRDQMWELSSETKTDMERT